MNTKENALLLADKQGSNEISEKKCKRIKFRRNTKGARVTLALMARSYNRFEAALEISDWCLHSTVSEIQAKGIYVAREWETVPGFQGNPTRCRRYWIPASEHKKAYKLLEAA
ncbi:MAG: hypothetical protein JAZ18_15790 [Candidatus Thiodiazotropha endolucinida]|nr:hypothetical protein [Candidatus Thiodiazotropha endolucinida]